MFLLLFENYDRNRLGCDTVMHTTNMPRDDDEGDDPESGMGRRGRQCYAYARLFWDALPLGNRSSHKLLFTTPCVNMRRRTNKPPPFKDLSRADTFFRPSANIFDRIKAQLGPRPELCEYWCMHTLDWRQVICVIIIRLPQLWVHNSQ